MAKGEKFGFSVFRFKNSKEPTPIESTKSSLMRLCALCLARQHQDTILKPQTEIHFSLPISNYFFVKRRLFGFSSAPVFRVPPRISLVFRVAEIRRCVLIFLGLTKSPSVFRFFGLRIAKSAHRVNDKGLPDADLCFVLGTPTSGYYPQTSN